MNVIGRIAWRNLLRHRGKSLVIGCILFTGALIMTVGNAIISGLDVGLTKNFRERLTGDIVVVSTDQLKDNVFFTPMGEPIESINQIDTALEIIRRHPKIAKALPMATGMVTVLNEDSEPFYQMLLGVDFDDYRATFPDGIEVIEGVLPSGDARGLLMSTMSRNELFNFANIWTIPKNSPLVTKNLPEGVTPNSIILRDQMIYMGYSDRNTILDIIAPVLGVGKYAAFNGLWGYFSLIDINSYNECMGFFEETQPTHINPQDQHLLAQSDENLDDALFGDETEAPPAAAPVVPTTQPVAQTSGYNLVLIRLTQPETMTAVISDLNQSFKKEKIPARAITWKTSLGQVGQMATIMRAVLFGFVMVVFVVAIIVITNTLSLAAMERVTEIGMMRAIGAKKRTISNIFILETGLLSLIFGGAGMITGSILVIILNMLKIKAANDFVELFYGGTTFAPLLTIDAMVLGIVQLLIVTLIAMIYPVVIARRISPMDAISRE